jgi:hypothetical protein
MGKNRRAIVAPEASKKNQIVTLGGDKIPSLEEELASIPDTDSAAHKRSIMRTELRGQFITLSDHVAESDIFVRNFKFHEADKVYSDLAFVDYRFVTKMYPYAKNGVLFVDEPRNEPQAHVAYEKQKQLKKLGYRHIVIEDDTTLFDCLEQLGEI